MDEDCHLVVDAHNRSNRFYIKAGVTVLAATGFLFKGPALLQHLDSKLADVVNWHLQGFDPYKTLKRALQVVMATSAARARSAARSAWWPSMPAVRCASGNGMISVLSCIHGGTASRSRQKWVCGGVSCAACGSGSRGIEPSSGGEGSRSEHGSEHSEDDVRPQSLVAARGSCLCPPAP